MGFGIHMTGAHGVLVTPVRQRMAKHREIVGVDVSTNALMRPVLYSDAYHHITVPGADYFATLSHASSLLPAPAPAAPVGSSR